MQKQFEFVTAHLVTPLTPVGTTGRGPNSVIRTYPLSRCTAAGLGLMALSNTVVDYHTRSQVGFPVLCVGVHTLCPVLTPLVIVKPQFV